MRNLTALNTIGGNNLLVTNLGLGQACGLQGSNRDGDGPARSGQRDPNSSTLSEELAVECLNLGMNLIHTGFADLVGNAPRQSASLKSREVDSSAQFSPVWCASVGQSSSNCGEQPVSSYPFSFEGVMESFEARCKALGTDRLEIVFLEGLGQTERCALDDSVNFSVAMQSGYRALQELKAQGLIDAIGFASRDIDACSAALDHAQWDCLLLSHRYTLLEQWAQVALLPKCQKLGVKVLIGEPFNSGILQVGSQSENQLWNYQPAPDFVTARVQNLKHLCSLHNIPLAAAALQFPATHPQVASVLPRLQNRRQLKDLQTMWNCPVPLSFWSDLKLAGLLLEETPIPGTDDPLHRHQPSKGNKTQ